MKMNNANTKKFGAGKFPEQKPVMSPTRQSSPSHGGNASGGRAPKMVPKPNNNKG